MFTNININLIEWIIGDVPVNELGCFWITPNFSPLFLWAFSQDPELSGKGTWDTSTVLGVEVKGVVASFFEAK